MPCNVSTISESCYARSLTPGACEHLKERMMSKHVSFCSLGIATAAKASVRIYEVIEKNEASGPEVL